VGLFVGPVILAVLLAIWREWLSERPSLTGTTGLKCRALAALPVLRHRNYRRFAISRLRTNTAWSMLAVAVGWQAMRRRAIRCRWVWWGCGIPAVHLPGADWRQVPIASSDGGC
jgi:hypothetical protein